jgi:hypothetical protein
MRARSWMAALALIGTTSILIGRGLSAPAPRPAQEPSPSKEAKKTPAKSGDESRKSTQPSGSPAENRKASGSYYPTIQVDLAVAGLGSEGCDVEIKPANRSCKFQPPSAQHVPSGGQVKIKLRDVELRGADKTCTIAITVREPGQPPQTIYRGFRPGSTKAGSIPTFNCYVSSRLVGIDAKATKK